MEKWAILFIVKVRGIHDSPVNVTRERKSVGKEHTYGQPLQTEEAVLAQLRQLAEKVEEALEKSPKTWENSGFEGQVHGLFYCDQKSDIARIHL